MSKSTSGNRERSGSTSDLVTIWVTFFVSLLAAVVGAGVVFDNNLTVYAACGEKSSALCSGVGWYGSMAISLAIGFGVVVAGLVLGILRHRTGRRGAWFSLGAFVGVILVTLLAIVFLRVTVP